MKRLLRYILCISVIVASSAAPTPAAAQINTDNVMHMGQNAIAFDDYLLAIQYFNMIIQAKPDLHKAYFGRGLAKFHLEDFAGAEADFSHALDISPFYPDAIRMRGASRYYQNKFDLAAADFGDYLKEYPADKNIMFHQGRALAENGEYTEADTIFGRLIQLDPKLEDAYFGRAMVKMSLSDTIAAKQYIERGLKYDKDNFWANATLYTIAAQYEKNDSAALRALDRLVAIDPDNTQVRFARSNMRYNMLDYSDAIDDLSHIIALEPDNDVALFNRALLRTELYDLDLALEDFSEILRRDPENDYAIYNRAAIYAVKGDYRNAISDVSRFIAMYPDLSSAYFMRSNYYLKLGDQRRAKADYDKGLALADSRRPIRHRTRHKSVIDTKIENLNKPEPEYDNSEELTPEEFERRLTNVIKPDSNDQLADKYEDSSIRGFLQNRNFDIDIEPMMQLSYFPAPSELRSRTYYIKEIDDINNAHLARKTICVEIHPPMLTAYDIDQLSNNVEYYTSVLSATANPRAIDYIDRALNQIMLRNMQAAVADCDRAIELTPDHPVAYMLRAQARNFDSASLMSRQMALKLITDDLRRAVELSPRNAVAWYNLGNALFEAGEYAEARSAYSSAIANQPDMGEAYFNRGYAALKLGLTSQGKTDLSKAGELGILPSYNLLKRLLRN